MFCVLFSCYISSLNNMYIVYLNIAIKKTLTVQFTGGSRRRMRRREEEEEEDEEEE